MTTDLFTIQLNSFAPFRKGDTSGKQGGIGQQNNATLSLGTVFNYTTSIYMPVTLMYL